MAHNLSWIDPEALKQLFAETAHRRLEDDAEAADPGSPPYSVGRTAPRAPEPRPPAARAPMAPSVRRATRPTPPAASVEPSAEASVEAFGVDADAPLEGRLSGLMRWACEATGLTRALIVDAEGLLVASQRAGVNAMDEAAAVVDLCAQRVPADVSAQESGTLTMAAGSRTHVVVWQATRHGRTYISLSGSASPSPRALSRLPAALREALR